MPKDEKHHREAGSLWIKLGYATLLTLSVAVTGCNNERKMHSRFPPQTTQKVRRAPTPTPTLTPNPKRSEPVYRKRSHVAEPKARQVRPKRLGAKCRNRLSVAEYKISIGPHMTPTKIAFVERHMVTVGNTVLVIVPGKGRTHRNREGIKTLVVHRFDLAAKKWLPQVALQLASAPRSSPEVRHVSARMVRNALVVTWKTPSGAKPHKTQLKAKSMSVATGRVTAATKAQVTAATKAQVAANVAARKHPTAWTFGLTPRLDAKTGVTVVNHYAWIGGSTNPKKYQKATLSRNGKLFATVRFPKLQGIYLGAFPAVGSGLFYGAQAYLVDLNTGAICRPNAKPFNFKIVHFPLAQGRWIVAVRRLMTKSVPSRCLPGAPCRSTPMPRLYGASLLVFTDNR